MLFVDNDGWHCFHQLAAALRRADIVPVRVVTTGTARGRYARIVDRLLYGDVIDLGAPGGIDRLRRLVDGDVLDAQVNEETLHQWGDDPVLDALVARASGVPTEQRREWTDKAALAHRLSNLGVPVPDQVAGVAATADQLERRFGYPLVVKRRVGAAGHGVRIAADRSALNAAVAELGPDPATLLVQRFVPGELVGYGAVRSRTGTLVEFTARETKGDTNPLGPTVLTRTVDDPRLAECGRAILDIVGCQGLAAVELLADTDGTYRFIDLSTRAWGGFLSFAPAGVDFAQAYIDALRGAADPARRTRPGRDTRVVTAAVEDDAHHLPVVKVALRTARDLRPYVRRLGWRYVCAAALGVLVHSRSRPGSDTKAAPRQSRPTSESTRTR